MYTSVIEASDKKLFRGDYYCKFLFLPKALRTDYMAESIKTKH